jgi:hypothetical protein
MLSSLSLGDRSSLNSSQHNSIASSTGASPLPTTIPHSSSVAAPRPSSSQEAQLRNAAATITTPSLGSSSSRRKHDLVGGGKENVSPAHPNKSSETSSSSHTGDGSLVVFPEKRLGNVKPSDAPSPSTQDLLRQQELQLRVLQEQVSACWFWCQFLARRSLCL